MKWLIRLFQRPDKSFFSVKIAGTKGKGSTGYLLESILHDSKIRTGFYCSPHLISPRERIRIGRKSVSVNEWVSALSLIKNKLRKNPLPKRLGALTYFEIMTLLAMVVFQRQNVEVAVFEVGMGGRLDATNVLDSKLCILTPVYFDHEQFLGNTLTKIAREKAGILREGCHAVVAPQQKEAAQLFDTVFRKLRVTAHRVKTAVKTKVGLKGDFQLINAAVASKAAQCLRDEFGILVRKSSFTDGLKVSDWPGRLEKVDQNGYRCLLDGAHNPSAIEALVRSMRRYYPVDREVVIFGVTQDKKFKEMLMTLSKFYSEIIVTEFDNARARSVRDLFPEAGRRFESVHIASNVSEALEIADRRFRGKRVTVTGSIYLLGDIKRELQKKRN